MDALHFKILEGGDNKKIVLMICSYGESWEMENE